MENDHDVCKAALDAAAKRIEELERENAELRGWKDSALMAEDLWDPQEIGRELDIPVGASIRASILPAIRRLKARQT